MFKSTKGAHYCFVCNRNSSKYPAISFFRFPKDENRCLLWKLKINHPDLNKFNAKYCYNHYRVCSLHFEDKMFSSMQRNRLKKHSVHTVFGKDYLAQDIEKENICETSGGAEQSNQNISQDGSNMLHQESVAYPIQTENMIYGDVCDLESVKEEVDMVCEDISIKIEIKEEQLVESEEFYYQIKLEGVESNLNEEDVNTDVADKFPAVNGDPLLENLTNHGGNSNTYSCQNGDYETKQKYNPPNNICRAMPTNEFKFCHLQMKTTENLKVDSKTKSKRKIYKYKNCSFSTTTKRNLTQHTVCHKSLDELIMYKCDLCPYETMHKRNLITHALKHKNPQQLLMYKCQQCEYVTKYKTSMCAHMAKHKNMHEVKMYKCDHNLCLYKSSHRRSYLTHCQWHKGKDKEAIYNSKYSLNRHSKLIHDNTSKIITYKCALCGLQTNCKHSYNKHLATHNPERPTKSYKVFNCTLCKYWTRRKCLLMMHMLKHKTKEQPELYKCDYCSFETKHRRDLLTHKIQHLGTKAAHA